MQNPSDRWILLPPIPRPKELTVALGNSEVTAIKWVSRCCPQISHSAIERLFRTRQACKSALKSAICVSIGPISRKDILPEGSVVYLRRFMLDESESRDQESDEYMQKDKNWVSTRKIYKPTHDDIKWARELVLHLDDHIIAINKPYGLAVQVVSIPQH
ncbi:hypothetical protein KP509_1Z176800 [Ceratopteris richardii]|nr:hypothetical protein KP509_1Z176800 [Ceratopteris richardii]